MGKGEWHFLEEINVAQEILLSQHCPITSNGIYTVTSNEAILTGIVCMYNRWAKCHPVRHDDATAVV